MAWLFTFLLLLFTTTMKATAGRAEFALVDAELEEAHAVSFIDSVAALHQKYNIAVDSSGWILVVPATEKREVDLFGPDAELRPVLLAASSYVKAAAESSTEESPDFKGIVAASKASFAWLKQHGASGVAKVKRSDLVERTAEGDISQATTLAKRVGPGTFGFYTDDDKGCGSLDLRDPSTDECHSVASSYASIKCENTSDNYELACKIYPHHDCTSNARQLTLAANQLSPCTDRPTYSWEGMYFVR